MPDPPLPEQITRTLNARYDAYMRSSERQAPWPGVLRGRERPGAWRYQIVYERGATALVWTDGEAVLAAWAYREPMLASLALYIFDRADYRGELSGHGGVTVDDGPRPSEPPPVP